MARVPMTYEEIEETRERILNTALDIIIQDGFANLSIRKIASKIGVSPTTIYNYYSGKDELNLMIRKKGFLMLKGLLLSSVAEVREPAQKISVMLKALVDFGRNWHSYYDIMFNLHTPKHLDYIGSDMEVVARKEKDMALECLELFTEAISDCLAGEASEKKELIFYSTLKFWSDIHGLITLCNSRLLHEVLDNVDDFVEKRCEGLVGEILSFK